MWAEIGGKQFFAQQACVDKIRHAVGEAVELLPDMVHLGPAFTEIYKDRETSCTRLLIDFCLSVKETSAKVCEMFILPQALTDSILPVC